MLKRAGILFGLGALLLNADTLTLRTGETVRGTYLGGTARQIRLDQNGEIRTFDIGQVRSVSFSDNDAPPPPPAYTRDRPNDRNNPNDRNPNDRYPNDRQPDRGAPREYASNNSTLNTTIPADTQITIRMIDAVNSETARLNQTFRASLDEPITVNGQELVPRGADVVTKLVDEQQSGKITGRTVLTLALAQISVNGRLVDVNSTDVRTASSSRGARSGKVIGGTAALGAIIGAVAGGGSGAAIGAASGAAVGTGAEVLTGGQKVKIPSETRLTFRLQTPAQI